MATAAVVVTSVVMSDDPKKRFLSPQAKRAAIEARRRFAEQNPPGAPQVFVVRVEDAQCGWEIRKFGSLVLNRSETGFATQLLARTAGEKALAALSATES